MIYFFILNYQKNYVLNTYTELRQQKKLQNDYWNVFLEAAFFIIISWKTPKENFSNLGFTVFICHKIASYKSLKVSWRSLDCMSFWDFLVSAFRCCGDTP